MISIHAPARGATIRSTKISMHKKFQSTLPRGERRLGGSGCPVDRYHFNPRSREGSDKGYAIIANLVAISIHAPARGATLEYDYETKTLTFQSTLPRGERPPLWLRLCPHHLFQSTLPRGERQSLRELLRELGEFQSTLPRGERPFLLQYL